MLTSAMIASQDQGSCPEGLNKFIPNILDTMTEPQRYLILVNITKQHKTFGKKFDIRIKDEAKHHGSKVKVFDILSFMKRPKMNTVSRLLDYYKLII